MSSQLYVLLRGASCAHSLAGCGIYGIFCARRGEGAFGTVKLRPAAFNGPDSPVELVRGVLVGVKIKVPWTALWSTPWVVEVSDAFFLLREKDASEASAHAAQTAPATPLGSGDDGVEGVRSEAQKPGFFTGVLDNLQVKIANVHVRYEAQHTPKEPFAAGVVMRLLQIQSTDASWKQSYNSDGASELVHKLFQLEHFAVYVNARDTLSFGEPRAVSDITELLRASLSATAADKYVPVYALAQWPCASR